MKAIQTFCLFWIAFFSLLLLPWSMQSFLLKTIFSDFEKSQLFQKYRNEISWDFNLEQQEKKIHQIFFNYLQPLFPENMMYKMLTEEEHNIFYSYGEALAHNAFFPLYREDGKLSSKTTQVIYNTLYLLVRSSKPKETH